MRTTIDLPDELVRRAKTIAARKGMTLKTLFTRALQRETSTLENAQGAASKKVRFPLITSSSDKDTISVSADTIEELLSLDDLK